MEGTLNEGMTCGKLTLELGVIYEGQFENGFITGYGKYTFTDGAHFEGMHIRGKMHGHGK